MGIFDSFSSLMEDKIMPVANKVGQQRHLASIRDAFISLLPIMLVGGIAAIINSPLTTDETTNQLLLAWESFADNNGAILNWIFDFTLGALSLYVCIGITHFLSRFYKINSFIPILFSVMGFFLLVTQPVSGEGAVLDYSFIDGTGLLPTIIIAIGTTELYRIMKQRNFGKISMPSNVPASLSDVFASLIPGMIIVAVFVAVHSAFDAFDHTLATAIFDLLSPTLNAADSLGFVVTITFVTHLFWFFGIHDATLAGVMGPIRDGNLSINASAQIAGEQLPHIFTTSFWTYFTVIGGSGSVIGLAILLVFMTKSKQLKTVGKVGIVPALFGISEPLIFGVPLMLNPIFLLPFLLTSTMNAIISYILMASGVIGSTFANLSWQMPPFIGAFFSTLDWKAPILVILLIILNALMYYPFVKIYDRQLSERENKDTEKSKEEGESEGS
ncbi:PTS sugar transporter subunit IIC [Virgibacillus sp. NKC19-3]|uniref:PTS sugar transporter subunit IIC n=1 Tax=Virgibacillus saliphilus TaxID=2831674 RepID=UPI001C9A741E|nr:PTS transporter subunit EIIC [Virgibacillus sp. NKC19-3]MBY7141977.1 PTS sugar transporter subunit IIC [Virgibacillus sp. NKC19-3]